MQRGARKKRALYSGQTRPGKLSFDIRNPANRITAHSPVSSLRSCHASSGEIFVCRSRVKLVGSQFEKTVFGFGPRAAAGTREGTYAPTTVVLRSFDARRRRRLGAESAGAGSNGADPDTARARSTAGEARFGVGDAATGCRVSGADRGDRARSCGRKARVHRGARFSCASAPA